jgi:hypothetical protein
VAEIDFMAGSRSADGEFTAWLVSWEELPDLDAYARHADRTRECLLGLAFGRYRLRLSLAPGLADVSWNWRLHRASDGLALGVTSPDRVFTGWIRNRGEEGVVGVEPRGGPLGVYLAPGSYEVRLYEPAGSGGQKRVVAKVNRLGEVARTGEAGPGEAGGGVRLAPGLDGRGVVLDAGDWLLDAGPHGLVLRPAPDSG